MAPANAAASDCGGDVSPCGFRAVVSRTERGPFGHGTDLARRRVLSDSKFAVLEDRVATQHTVTAIVNSAADD
jgi:hypothetical protein